MAEQSSSSEASEMPVQPGPSAEEEQETTESSEVSEATSSDSDPDFVPAPSSSSCSSLPPSSEDEENTEDPKDGWVAKNGQVWFPTNAETTHFSLPPRGLTQGPTHYAIVRVKDPESAFNLFFTPEMKDMIIEMTNLNGCRKGKGWMNVDSTELHAYFGLLILAGVYRSRGESTRCLWDDRRGRSIFRATMSLRRFHEINAALCFANKAKKAARPRDDKLQPIRNLWTMWTHRLPLLFNPGKNVTVDEQLVAFKGKCRFRQYMPKKPSRYGLKLWVTADVDTSYAWKCEIYLGKTGDTPEVGQGKRVVLEMTEGLKGVTVTCDNFFTSYSLGQELLQRKIALVGTIRRNKTELPPNLVKTGGRTVFSSVFGFTKNTTAVSYIPRRGKDVILISTKHREAVLTNTPKIKPAIIMDYNECKGGVDTLDQIVNTYSTRRKTSRWSQTLFFNMIDISAYNAFVIFTAVEPSWNKNKKYKRRLFLEELGNALVSPTICGRKRVPQAPIAAALVREMRAEANLPPPGLLPPIDFSLESKRGSCKFCEGKRKRTHLICAICGVHTCKDHKVVCCNSCATRCHK